MKRRRKQVFAMAAVLAVLVAATVAVKLLNPESAAEDTSTTVFSATTESVTAISWTNEAGSVAFIKENGSWKYAVDSAFPLDTTELTEMLELVCNLTAKRKVEAPQALSEYGLAEPAVTVSVQSAGKTTQLAVGRQNGMDSLYYLSNGDGNVYLVEAGLFNHFSRGLYDLAVLEEIPDMTEVTGVMLETGAQTLDIVVNADDGSWYFKDTEILLADEPVQALLDTVTAICWNQCVAYNAQEADLEKYGLDVPGAILEITCYTGNGKVPFRVELGLSTDNGCYAKIADSSMIYLIDQDILDATSTDPDSLVAAKPTE